MHPLHEIYVDAVAQAETGKGFERHSKGKGFYDQRWKSITDEAGMGFLTGQAMKKLAEATGRMDDISQQEWEKEMLGAMNYMAMAMLYRRHYVRTV